ncbi:unnamed protein product [Protopolystoma xenopodis]|uniref:Uncharacterized protein n=1 Tax=Protopolystoma xenopodis TaxID=117903 RepID=A0A448WA08_9PLAT|nr:unnamed protein product [Protopolystoma xenopodis]
MYHSDTVEPSSSSYPPSSLLPTRATGISPSSPGAIPPSQTIPQNPNMPFTLDSRPPGYLYQPSDNPSPSSTATVAPATTVYHSPASHTSGLPLYPLGSIQSRRTSTTRQRYSLAGSTSTMSEEDDLIFEDFARLRLMTSGPATATSGPTSTTVSINGPLFHTSTGPGSIDVIHSTPFSQHNSAETDKITRLILPAI